jgi:hypothetical protein
MVVMGKSDVDNEELASDSALSVYGAFHNR